MNILQGNLSFAKDCFHFLSKNVMKGFYEPDGGGGSERDGEGSREGDGVGCEGDGS